MNIKYLYPRTWDYLLKPVHLKGTAKNLTEAYEKTKPLLVASKIIVHLVCKMNWVTANKSSTYYDINYGASSCSQWSLRDLQNAASIWILNAVQAAYFVTFWTGCGFQGILPIQLCILKSYRSLIHDRELNIKKPLAVSAVSVCKSVTLQRTVTFFSRKVPISF